MSSSGVPRPEDRSRTPETPRRAGNKALASLKERLASLRGSEPTAQRCSNRGVRQPSRPGGNPGAYRWFLQSTPLQFPPESGGICGRLTSDLPLGCLQGGLHSACQALLSTNPSSSLLSLQVLERSLSLKLSDTKVYEPQIRARLGTSLRGSEPIAQRCTELRHSALEATQGQIDGFLSQLPYKCHQNRVASVTD